MIHSALACNLDTNVLRAALPLLQKGQVQAIEWSFDTLFQMPEVPDWFTDLLQAFSQEGRLMGHGVFFSLFSGKWLPEQEAWLAQLQALSKRFPFAHITEHFGFMTGADFHKGAPISIPFNATTLAIGQDRLKRIYQACSLPVGLENLAFAYSLDEVKRHGAFLAALLEPVNGFIILDIHNLYCQLHNFNQSFEEIIRLYPLDRVREIHISGGSWEDSAAAPDRQIRRDTHDEAVPVAVFDLLQKAIPLCPNLQFVVLEQLGNGLETPAQQRQFQLDYLRMQRIVAAAQQDADSNQPKHTFFPQYPLSLDAPLEDPLLHQQQTELSTILETAGDIDTVQKALARSSLAHTDWKVEEWEPAMLETVHRIAQKWKAGWY
jgi:uncharacterized protein (UPF0276 family)